MISPQLCIKCKGRLFCGLKNCPLLERYSEHRRVASLIEGNEFAGSSPPSVFVSWQNYPRISVAPLAPPLITEQAALMDNPERWYGMPEKRIISFREQLIHSSMHADAASASNPDYKTAALQELAMSAEPVDIDIELLRKPAVRLSFSDTVAPLGPSAPLRKFSLSENPRIPKKAERIISDTDAKALAAMQELYSSGMQVHYIQNVLSAGLLGIGRKRRFVPTRWAITAVDSNLAEILLGWVKQFAEISETLVFSSSYLHNSFHIVLFPSNWQFEQLEAWQPGSVWTQGATEPNIISDHEFFNGRKNYAEDVAGAYYAAKLAVAEHLAKEKRQAGCLVFREIGQEYKIPLGVWQIRENVREALRRKPLRFSELRLALRYLETKLTIPMRLYEHRSALLDALKHQRRISEWFGQRSP